LTVGVAVTVTAGSEVDSPATVVVTVGPAAAEPVESPPPDAPMPRAMSAVAGYAMRCFFCMVVPPG
jgi:hypothetical protein